MQPSDLVSWDPKQNRFGPFTRDTFEDIQRSVETDYRPQEVRDLIAALDAFWQFIGLRSLCGPCFRKERPQGSLQNGGCCGGCPHLGHHKCVAKPVACAMWYCGGDGHATPMTAAVHEFHTFYHKLTGRIYNRAGVHYKDVLVNFGFRSDGWKQEQRHTYTKWQIAVCRATTGWLRRYVESTRPH